MNKLMFLIFIAFAALMSCDGRDRVFKDKVEALKENNLFKAFNEQIIYTPTEPVEIIKDTTLVHNNVRVIVAYKSLDNSFVYNQDNDEDGSVINHFYRNFEAEIKVYHDDESLPIIKKIINKTSFSVGTENIFWSNAIMQYVWLDEFASNQEALYFNVSFCDTNADICRDFRLSILTDGTMKTTEIDLSKHDS